MHVPDIYAKQNRFTDPGEVIHLYDDLPDSPARLREMVSQLVTHVSWVARYGIPADRPLPRDAFLTARQAWQSIRAGASAAEAFGHGAAGGVC